MTRKEELQAKSRNFLHQHHYLVQGRSRNCDLECLAGMLSNVERDVWEQAAQIVEDGRFSSESAQEVQWRNATARLLRQQQEEL